MTTIIFGHRGASAIKPENTMLAFQKAIDDGAHGIEFDIRITKDRKIVVIHDATINRTSNGTGKVSKLTYNELLEFDFGKGEKIPLLSLILEKFGNNYWLNIEVKEEGFEKELVELIGEMKLTKKFVISSFNTNVLKKLSKINKSLPLALLFVNKSGDLGRRKENLGINSIHPNKNSINKRLMKKAVKYNLIVRAWTVNNITKAKKLVKLGVEGIITDNPKEILNGLLNEK